MLPVYLHLWTVTTFTTTGHSAETCSYRIFIESGYSRKYVLSSLVVLTNNISNITGNVAVEETTRSTTVRSI